MQVFKYSVFPSVIAFSYYQFNILLLYVCKYFLKFPFWIVNSDLSVLTYEAADKFTCGSLCSLVVYYYYYSLTSTLTFFYIHFMSF